VSPGIQCLKEGCALAMRLASCSPWIEVKGVGHSPNPKRAMRATYALPESIVLPNKALDLVLGLLVILKMQQVWKRPRFADHRRSFAMQRLTKTF